MSYRRVQGREVNRIVMLDNRLSNLTNSHNYDGDLHIERNQTIGGNVDICGNLTIGGDLRARNYYASGNYYLNNYVLIPAGTIIQSAAINEPAGWLDCNGRTLLVAEYAYLFSAIGYTYSSGVYSGSDLSFNIPDMRGRIGIGSGTGSGLSARTLGVSGGAETHTLTVGEMPAHSHTSNAIGGSTGLVTSDSQNTASSGLDTTSNEPNLYERPVALTINDTGSGSAHNNMQPYMVLRYLIKY
jgi:microcystin-dependent protein